MSTHIIRFSSSWIFAHLKQLAAFFLLGLLFYLVDFSQVWQSLIKLDFRDILALLLISILLVYLSALKWHFFLQALGAQLSVLSLFNLYLLGYFVNTVLPSYLGGDVVRSHYAGKKVGQIEAITATVLERYTGLVAMVGLGFISVWIAGQVTWQVKLVVLLIVLGVVVATVLALSNQALELLSRVKFLKKIVAPLRKIQAGLHLAGSNRSLLLKAMALSLLYHSFTVVNTLVAAHAIGWENPPLLGMFVVLPLILLIGAIPVTPSGLGIQEGAFVYFLHSIGASQPEALAIALVLRAKTYILALFGALVWLRLRVCRESNG